MIQPWHEYTHTYTRTNTHTAVRGCVLGLGLGSVLEKRRKMGKMLREGRGREEESDFTFCACCLWQTADLQRRHARLGNNSKMRTIPKNYMKWATCFQVVQLDYPLHFLIRVQSRDRYKEPATSKHHRYMCCWAHSERESMWQRKTEGVGKVGGGWGDWTNAARRHT